MRSSWLIITLGLLVLPGCTAYPVQPQDRAIFTPPSKSGTPPAVAPDVTHLSPVPDRALLVVYRSHAWPARRAVTIYVNGAMAAELEDGYYTVMQLPVGHAHIESGWSFDIGWLQPSGYADPDLQAGKTYYFQVVDGLSLVGVIGIVPLVTDASPAGMGFGAVMFVADEADARYTGRALQAETESSAHAQLQQCTYVLAQAGFALIEQVPAVSRTN